MLYMIKTRTLHIFTFLPNIPISWRMLWYSVLIWFLGFMAAEVVIIPWFYLVSVLTVFGATVYYFKVVVPPASMRGRKAKGDRDKLFIFGLGAAMAWFIVVLLLTLFEIAHFYYFNFLLYFSDFRNWYLLPLILLVPVLYGIFLENKKMTRGKKSKVGNMTPASFKLAKN